MLSYLLLAAAAVVIVLMLRKVRSQPPSYTSSFPRGAHAAAPRVHEPAATSSAETGSSGTP